MRNVANGYGPFPQICDEQLLWRLWLVRTEGYIIIDLDNSFSEEGKFILI